MKKAMIIYAVIFVMTMIIPAFVCFTEKNTERSQEMVSIFRGEIDYDLADCQQ